MNSAASSFHIPYLQTPNPVGFAQEVAKLCNRDVLQVGVNSELSGDKLADKQVVSIDLPELHCMGKHRKTQMLDLGACFHAILVWYNDTHVRDVRRRRPVAKAQEADGTLLVSPRYRGRHAIFVVLSRETSAFGTTACPSTCVCIFALTQRCEA